jgi:N-methylhydantoinase B
MLAGVGDAGMLWRDSVELDELRFPMLIRSQRLLLDTEGAGRTRGAPAACVEYGPTDSELEVIYASDGSINPARGVGGGQDGSPARAQRRTSSGRLEDLSNCAHVRLAPGEAIVSICCSGAGYGDPFERDPEAVAADVRERFITRARAEAAYGVVVDERGVVDRQASEELRTRSDACTSRRRGADR